MLKQCKRCFCAKHIRGQKIICKRCEEEMDKVNKDKLSEQGAKHE